MIDLLPLGRQSVLLIDKLGNQLTDRAVTSLRFEGGKGITLPVDMHVVHEAASDRNCLTSLESIPQALEVMTWVDPCRGISACALTDTGRISMALPWRLLKLLFITHNAGHGTLLPWASPKLCMSCSRCITLQLIVRQGGMT